MSLEPRHEAAILVVDDNPADARLIREALDGKPIHVAEDGYQALDFLARIVPRLVLLDLSLPMMTGHEVLREIRSRRQLAAVPVVVFSSSDSQEDMERAYAFQANCYVTKPAGLDQFLDTVRRIHQFWLEPR